MADKIIPHDLEGFNSGMNDVDNIKRLIPSVVNYLHNAYPDKTLKPLNGINDIDSGTTLTYSGEDAAPVNFTAISQYIHIDGIDFIFVIARDRGYLGNSYLTIWNVTDGQLHQWFGYSHYDTTDDFCKFSLTKRYNSIYLTMSNAVSEVADGPDAGADSHRQACKNKIYEWDSDTSLWVGREMGIDFTPKLTFVDVRDIGINPLRDYEFYSMATLGSKTFIAGGVNADTELTSRAVYYTYDGFNWIKDSSLPTSYTANGDLVEHNGKLYYFSARKGYSSLTYENKVFRRDERNDGEIQWSTVKSSTDWTEIEGFRCLSYDNKLWLTGGAHLTNPGDLYYNEVYYSSDGGANWGVYTDALNWAGSCDGLYGHSATVYDGKMWIFGGASLNVTPPAVLGYFVLYSTNGSSWSQANALNPPEHFEARINSGAIGFNNNLWVFGGYDPDVAGYNDAWFSKIDSSSYDAGEEWYRATDTLPYKFLESFRLHRASILNGKMFVGQKDNFGASVDGITWALNSLGIDANKYYSYAFTFVRRTDKHSYLATSISGSSTIDFYDPKPWESLDGVTVPPIDEKLLSGTASLSGTTLSGSGTAFESELTAGDYIRAGGATTFFKITVVTNDTTATVKNSYSESFTSEELSKIPAAGDSITTDVYHPGELEGVEDQQNRCVVYFSSTSSTDKGMVIFKFQKRPYDEYDDEYINKGVLQGATHIRVYRTLGHDDEETVKGLVHRYLIDIAITGPDVEAPDSVFVDRTTDDYLRGITNYLEMTGYSIPPFAAYSIWANDMLWLSGITTYDFIDEYFDDDDVFTDLDGYVFHSVNPKSGLISFSAEHPKKFASMFDLSNDYNTFGPNNGQKDTGLATLEGDLYLFKENSVYIIYNSDPNNKPVIINSYLGCVCPNTIVNACIPMLGGEVILFYSGDGWVYIQPGGKFTLFTEFKISYVQPDVNGILRRNATGNEGDPTDWYSRNKVSAAYWRNALWMFFGDYKDDDSQINEQASGNGSLICCAFYFAPDNESRGPFIRDFTNISTKYEPQLLVSIDNNKAYTFSHRDEFKLTRWNDPTQFVDTLIESDTPTNYNNTIKVITRAYESDLLRMAEWLLDKVFIYMDFDDTDTLTIKIYTDVNKQVATCTFSQERESGMISYSDSQYRDFIVIKSGEDLRHAFYHHVEITKQIPSDGNLEIHGIKLKIHDPLTRKSDEHMDQFGAASNVTFVVETGTDPEVDAHA